MKAPITIQLQAGSRNVVLHRIPQQRVVMDWKCGYWDMWINTRDYKHGTLIRLYDNGKIERITVRKGDEADEVVLIKPEDS